MQRLIDKFARNWQGQAERACPHREAFEAEPLAK